MENNKENILGCFFKIGFDPNLSGEKAMDLANTFRAYIWGESGINNVLKTLKHENYGKDLMLVLFEFYVKPLPIETQALKEIGSYRKNEKSIGIPIIVTEENFFSKSEQGRYGFLKQSILQKLDLLGEVVKKKKLDTKVDQLKYDLEKLLL